MLNKLKRPRDESIEAAQKILKLTSKPVADVADNGDSAISLPKLSLDPKAFEMTKKKSGKNKRRNNNNQYVHSAAADALRVAEAVEAEIPEANEEPEWEVGAAAKEAEVPEANPSLDESRSGADSSSAPSPLAASPPPPPPPPPPPVTSERMKSDEEEFHRLHPESPYCVEWAQTDSLVKFLVKFPRPVVKDSASVEVSPDRCLVVDAENAGDAAASRWSARFWRNVEETKTKVLIKGDEVHVMLVKKDTGIRWERLMLPPAPPPPPPPPPPPRVQSRKERNDKVDVAAETPSESAAETPSEAASGPEEPVFKLDHLKHSWYEKGSDMLAVQVFVKDVSTSHLKIDFARDSLRIRFKTADAAFLKMQTASSSSLFEWAVRLRNGILPEQSYFKLNKSNVEISLKKDRPGHWVALEASSVGAVAKRCPAGVVAKKISDDVNAATTTTTKPVHTKPAYSTVPHLKDDVSPGTASTTTTTASAAKPTCMVSPLVPSSSSSSSAASAASAAATKSDPGADSPVAGQSRTMSTIPAKSPGSFVVGTTGLDNMGNTCFMNSVLQCLANTRELRDYFLSNRYQTELNRENPLGLGGNLAISFGVLMRVLWSGSYASTAPAKLKALIAQKAGQFVGFAQHDAQEFLAFLLDGLHEDLNRVVDKPYTVAVEADGRSDQVVAEEAWQTHLCRNDSEIVDLFSGQYKSKLTCPVCDKVSVTFDPFTYLTVPLPKRKLLLPVTFMWADPHRSPLKYLVPYSKETGTVEILKAYVSDKNTGLSPGDLVVFEVVRHRIHRVFESGARLNSVSPSDNIVVAERLPQNLAPGEKIVEVLVIQRTLSPTTMPTRCSFCRKDSLEGSLRRCSKCFKVGYCDHTCQRSHWSVHKPICRNAPEPVGIPFLLSLPESQITFQRLVHYLQNFAALSVDVFRPPSKSLGAGGDDAGATDASTLGSPTTPVDQPAGIDSSDAGFDDEDDDDNSGFVSAASSTSSICSSSATAPPPPRPAEESSSDDRPSRIVHGVPQRRDNAKPAFRIRVVDERGNNVGEILDGGSEGEACSDVLLDLSDKPFLAIDWKNNSAWEGSVMVQSRSEIDSVDGDAGAGAFAARLAANNLFSSSSNANENSDSWAEDVGALDECLEKFTEAEVLGEDDLWYCPRCKEHRQASKRLTLWKLPKILLLHLKRFSFRNFIWRDKITKHVDFPLRGLDMKKFCPSLPPAASGLYDLYAVINHFGGIMGGHYTAFARLPAGDGRAEELPWRVFDDSHVTPMTRTSDVVSRHAYVLFYVRRDDRAEVCRGVDGVASSSSLSASGDGESEEEEDEEEEEREETRREPRAGDRRGDVERSSGVAETSTGAVRGAGSAGDFKLWRKGSDTSTCTEDTLLSSGGTDCDEID